MNIQKLIRKVIPAVFDRGHGIRHSKGEEGGEAFFFTKALI